MGFSTSKLVVTVISCLCSSFTGWEGTFEFTEATFDVIDEFGNDKGLSDVLVDAEDACDLFSVAGFCSASFVSWAVALD